MMRLRTLCLIALSLAQQPARDATLQAVTQSTGTASLAGVVVSGDSSSTPIRRARVTLNRTDGTIGRTETTDDQGRFLFRDLPAGRYALASTKPAWLTTNYGAAKPGRPGTPVAIADGERVAGLTISMARGAVVTGVVRDQNGQPAPGVRVQVGRIAMVDGQRTIPSLSGADTDDAGVYRVFGLPPGDVVVMASMLSAQMTFGQDASEVQLVVPDDVRLGREPTGPRVKPAPVFYPDTTDVAGATLLTLSTGEERSGIDIRLQFVPTAHIRGVVTDPSGIAQPRSSVVALSKGYSPGRGDLLGFNAAITDAAGRYEVMGLSPGEYTLIGGTDTATFETDVVVDGRDLTVPLTIQPNPTISGRVVFVGASTRPPLRSIRVSMTGRTLMSEMYSRGSSGAPLEPDGTFANQIPPGLYQMGFTGLPAGWSARSVMARGQDVLDTPIRIGFGDPTVEFVITFTDHPTELTGTLVDASGRPAAEYFVIVFSKDRRFWAMPTRRVTQVRPANDGAFSVKALPAGEYYVAALTDIDPAEPVTPELLGSLVEKAATISLVEGQKSRVSLRMGTQRP